MIANKELVNEWELKKVTERLMEDRVDWDKDSVTGWIDSLELDQSNELISKFPHLKELT